MMSKEYYELKTDSGLTTLRLSDISAITTEGSGGVLKKERFKIAIHLVSGTIFTGLMDKTDKEALITKWTEAWKYAIWDRVTTLFKFIFRVRLFRFLASNDFEEHLKNLEDSPANMDEIEHPIGTIQQVTEWDGGHFRWEIY